MYHKLLLLFFLADTLPCFSCHRDDWLMELVASPHVHSRRKWGSNATDEALLEFRTHYILSQVPACMNESITRKKLELCVREEKNMMAAIQQGINNALHYCQHQFRDNRWNCTAPQGQRKPFGNITNYATAETAYLYAITSAAVAYSLIQACAENRLSLTCDCTDSGELPPWPDNFTKWENCSINIDKGLELAARFTDKTEKMYSRNQERQLINLHNNKAGRQAVKNSVETVCRCLEANNTGKCLRTTCYREMQQFGHVAAQLKWRYKNAVKVKVNKQSTQLRPATANSYPFTIDDLVYNHRTGDLCDRHLSRGILGVRGRECSLNRNHTNYCDVFCCWHGYETQVESITYECNCRLIWLPYLQLNCSLCRREIVKYVCN